jgi:hypothetical protein
VNSGNKTISVAVFGVLGVLATAKAGHPGEDSIQEIWLAAERACHGNVAVAEAPLTPPAGFAIPASVQWSPDPWRRDCE